MAKRKIEEDYHELAGIRGFRWVGSVLPKNSHVKTQWLCKEGHKWYSSYHNIQDMRGCPTCAGNAKKTEKDYHILAKSRGFRWVGGVLPKNIITKSRWRCEKGHEWETIYNSIQQGSGCPLCSKIAKKVKQDYYILAEHCNFRWVGTKLPENVNIKTKWKCKKNHEWEATYGTIYSGGGCPFCAGKSAKVKQDYRDLAKLNGFKWLGESLPKNINIKTWWECKNNHKWSARYNSIQQGCGCPICQDIINGAPVSKPQIKLNNLLCGSLNYPEGRYRIDVAIMRKSKKIAVEYDAQYWHNGREEYDEKRDKFLISRGWKIIHVKSRTLLPTRKQLMVAVGQLLIDDKKVHNIYLEDWV